VICAIVVTRHRAKSMANEQALFDSLRLIWIVYYLAQSFKTSRRRNSRRAISPLLYGTGAPETIPCHRRVIPAGVIS